MCSVSFCSLFPFSRLSGLLFSSVHILFSKVCSFLCHFSLCLSLSSFFSAFLTTDDRPRVSTWEPIESLVAEDTINDKLLEYFRKREWDIFEHCVRKVDGKYRTKLREYKHRIAELSELFPSRIIGESLISALGVTRTQFSEPALQAAKRGERKLSVFF